MRRASPVTAARLRRTFTVLPIRAHAIDFLEYKVRNWHGPMSGPGVSNAALNEAFYHPGRGWCEPPNRTVRLGSAASRMKRGRWGLSALPNVTFLCYLPADSKGRRCSCATAVLSRSNPVATFVPQFAAWQDSSPQCVVKRAGFSKVREKCGHTRA